MGRNTRLHGKIVTIQGEKKETCPNCGGQFSKYRLITRGKKSIKRCPFCQHEYPQKNKKN